MKMGRRIRNTYFTSDLHIGHDNSLIYDKRPFKDMDHMIEGIVRRFNSVVRPQDLLYILGDVGFGSELLRKVIGRLNGTKILILGNHDKKQQAMLNVGFDVVLNSASMIISGELVSMTHCPLRGIRREDTRGMRGCDGTENWHNELKYPDYSIEDGGAVSFTWTYSQPERWEVRKDTRATI